MTKLHRILIQIAMVLLLLAACHTSEKTQALVPTFTQEDLQELAPVVSNNQNSSTEVQRPVDVQINIAPKDRLSSRLDSLMNDPWLKTTQMGLYIYDLTDNRPLYDQGKHQRMRPASTMKVITAITALAQLGGDYNYSTRLYTNGKIKGGKLMGDIYVRGGFDPLFDNKGINAFISALTKKGIKRIQGNLIIDLSMKDKDKAGAGWCWDDKNPSLSPMLFKGKDTFGTIFIKALQNRGISISSKIKTGRTPSTANLIHNHKTPIAEILDPMMKESVNQDAESLFYQIAAQTGKPYASGTDASRYIKQFVNRELHLDSNEYFFADGSGLSLYDYVTPELLVVALKYAYEHKNIYDPLILSLPIAGVDGTLEHRMLHTAAYRNVYAKTGTVTGICSLAGYATAANGHTLCFAIINQGQKRSAEARIFQDKVCCIMTE